MLLQRCGAAGLARDHAFVDGNKRVARLASYVFLRPNGRVLDTSDGDAERMTPALSAREADEDAYAD